MTSPKSPINFHGRLMNIHYMNEFVAKRGLHTYGTETNVANMCRCALSLYETLKDKFNLEDFFFKEPDKTIYRRFLNRLRLERVENELYPVDSEALEEIRKYRIARVCGTGPLGRAVCKALESYNVLIGGFLTNESENAPTIFMGRSVEKIEEAEIPNDVIVIVIVASRPALWEEIRAALEKRNIRCMSHSKLSAAFPPWAS